MLTRAGVECPAMLVGCAIGAAMFLLAAVLAENNALMLPAVVLAVAGVASVLA